jgi:cystatin-A/B
MHQLNSNAVSFASVENNQQTTMSVPGGLHESKPADAEATNVAEQVRAQLEEKAGGPFPVFEVISYNTQVVAGTNFFIKIKTGEHSYIHARVFRSLPHAGNALTVHSIQSGKTAADPIAYF